MRDIAKGIDYTIVLNIQSSPYKSRPNPRLQIRRGLEKYEFCVLGKNFKDGESQLTSMECYGSLKAVETVEQVLRSEKISFMI